MQIKINQHTGEKMPEKRLTLNSEKRKAIADVFQNHFEQTSPKNELHKKAIANYNEARTKIKVLAENIVRYHQPQEDVDTIRSMIAKYNRSGGELYNDNCFYFTAPPRMETDYEGNPKETVDEEHVKFELKEEFARSYIEMRLKQKVLTQTIMLQSMAITTKEVQVIILWKAKLINF